MPPSLYKSTGSSSTLDKRQVYDPNPNIVPTIPGCHDPWIKFLLAWYEFVYYYSFAMIPFSLMTFVSGLLGANHLYKRNE